MKFLIISAIALFLVSCSQQRYCQPSKRSKDWAVLQPGTITDSIYVRTTLLSAHRSMKGGFKHLFITDNNDTIVRHENENLKVGECYFVLKSI